MKEGGVWNIIPENGPENHPQPNQTKTTQHEADDDDVAIFFLARQVISHIVENHKAGEAQKNVADEAIREGL